MRRNHGLVLVLVLLAGSNARNATADEITLREDFEQSIERWQPTDPKMWSHGQEGSKHFLRLLGKSTYEPPFRSPHSIALLRDVRVGDFDLTVRMRSTTRDYGHRDLCVIFGYQDPSHFYYAHFGKQTDDHANQIFLVNETARAKISTLTSAGTPWDDDWHTVRIVRRIGDGTIRVFFDDLGTPVMTATDRTFLGGQIGLGSFDDAGDFDDVELVGEEESEEGEKGGG